jgi:hypothetical protein
MRCSRMADEYERYPSLTALFCFPTSRLSISPPHSSPSKDGGIIDPSPAVSYGCTSCPTAP